MLTAGRGAMACVLVYMCNGRERHLTIRDEAPHHWLLSAMR
jgi:hypothetical protein